MAFFQCSKCKKTWQHPVEKCPDCFLKLERMKSENIKVIGVSKVSIPTMVHPLVPYFVLVLEDEKGNKWVHKSVKEYKIGENFSIQKRIKSKNKVAIWRLKYDVLEGMEKAIELIGGINVDPNFKILILPSLNSPKHSYFAENTSPQFLENLILYLKEKGVKPEKIKVCGQSFDEIPIELSVQKSQLLKVCQDYNVMPLDLAKAGFAKRSGSQLNFEVSEEVFNSDLIINLPVLKIGKISASENVLKFLKKENYLSLKYLSSEDEIIENLRKVLPESLTLAEAQSVQKSDQFITHLNLILAGFDYLSLDRIFAEISMIKELPEILKKIKIEDIPTVGRDVKEIQYETEKY